MFCGRYPRRTRNPRKVLDPRGVDARDVGQQAALEREEDEVGDVGVGRERRPASRPMRERVRRDALVTEGRENVAWRAVPHHELATRHVRLALAQMSPIVFPAPHMLAWHANEHSPPAADAKPLEAFSGRSP